MSAISGRTGGDDSRCSSHVLFNNAHNGSENPTVGRSGRFPVRTFRITAASSSTCSKGRRPVTTYRESERRRGDGKLMYTSRVVIPRAYISVLFDGNLLRDRSVYPNLYGSRISGAIHRVVPPVLWPLGISPELASSMIAVSPKSAKQAWHSELTRMLACVLTSWVNKVNSRHEDCSPLRCRCGRGRVGVGTVSR